MSTVSSPSQQPSTVPISTANDSVELSSRYLCQTPTIFALCCVRLLQAALSFAHLFLCDRLFNQLELDGYQPTREIYRNASILAFRESLTRSTSELANAMQRLLEQQQRQSTSNHKLMKSLQQRQHELLRQLESSQKMMTMQNLSSLQSSQHWLSVSLIQLRSLYASLYNAYRQQYLELMRFLGQQLIGLGQLPVAELDPVQLACTLLMSSSPDQAQRIILACRRQAVRLDDDLAAALIVSCLHWTSIRESPQVLLSILSASNERVTDAAQVPSAHQICLAWRLAQSMQLDPSPVQRFALERIALGLHASVDLVHLVKGSTPVDDGRLLHSLSPQERSQFERELERIQ